MEQTMAKTSELQEGSGWEFLQLTIEREGIWSQRRIKRCGWDLETLDFQTSWLHETECFYVLCRSSSVPWAKDQLDIEQEANKKCEYSEMPSHQDEEQANPLGCASDIEETINQTFPLTLDLTNLTSQSAPLKKNPHVLCETCSKLTQRVARWRLTEQISLEQRQCRRMERELEAGSWKCWTRRSG